MVARILQAETGDLRVLAELAGGDPRTFYIGTSLSGADVRGQDLRGMILPGLDLDHLQHDAKTLKDEAAESPPDVLSVQIPLIYLSEREVDRTSLDRLIAMTPIVLEEARRDAFLVAADLHPGPILILAWNEISTSARYAAEELTARGRAYVLVVVESHHSLGNARDRREGLGELGPVLSVPPVSTVYRTRLAVVTPETLDAVGVLAELWGDRDRLFKGGDAFFLRARGVGPSRQLDAAAQMLDRLAALRLAPQDMSVVAPFSRRRLGVDIDPIAKRLLRGTSVSGFSLTWSRSPFDLGVFGDPTRMRSDTSQAYFDTVLAGLQRRGVIVKRAKDGGSISLRDVQVEVRRDDGRVRGTFHPDLEGPRAINIVAIDKLVISESADLTVIVQEAERGALWATSRDMMALDFDSPNLWMVVAAQLRRVSRAMGGKPKQLYLEMLIWTAIRMKALDAEFGPELEAALNSPDFSETHSLSLTYLDVQRSGTTGRLKIRPLRLETSLPGELSLFLTIDPDGVELADSRFGFQRMGSFGDGPD